MPLKNSNSVPIPYLSVPSFVFGACTTSLPREPIILDPERPHDRYLSLESYRHWSQCLAKGLQNTGIEAGQRVLFVSGNSIAWPVVFMGTLMVGGILTGVSPALPVDSLVRLAQGLKPSLIFASEDVLANATIVAERIGLASNKIYLFESENLFADGFSPSQDNHWHQLLDQNGESFDWTTRDMSPDDLAAINYTSGSTGFSKGVMVSHRNIISNAVQYLEQQKVDPLGPETGVPTNWVMWAPFYHVIGLNQFCVIAPKRGIRNHIMQKLDLELLLRYTERYRPSTMLLLPPLLILLLSSPLVNKYDLSSLHNVSVGGAPLRLSLIKRFERLMPNPDCRVIQGWGMTEITCIVVNRNPLDRSTSHCVGELLPNVEIKIMAPDGATELIGPYQSGELWVRSPNVTLGYWQDADRTLATYLPDGWLRTGDFGYYDDQERWYVTDRIQDIIHLQSPAGAYILPTDLESMLLDLPGVKDAGVTSVRGLSDAVQTVPRGFVVLDETIQASIETVTAAFNVRVKEHEQLKGGLHALNEVPKLPSGKVDRQALSKIVV